MFDPYIVKSEDDETVANCRYVEDAAALLVNYDNGTIQDGRGNILYQAGKDGDPANSYDAVSEIVEQRKNKLIQLANKRARKLGLS